VIPEAAVEAALDVFWAKENEPYRAAMRAALEAAAPHMLMRGGDSYQTQYKQNELGEWREEAPK